MHTKTIEAPRRRLLRRGITVLAAAAATSAWADEPSPYYIGASVAFTHDSNVYRVPDGVGDNYWSTGLLGGFDQSIGRQRVYAAANVAYNKFQDQTTLNNTSYGVNAGWDWQTIEKLSGRLFGSANQNLAGYDNGSALPASSGGSGAAQFARNQVQTDLLGTTVRWGGDSLLTLEGSYVHSRVRYSEPAYQFGDSTGDTAGAGVYYMIGAVTKVGAGVRFSRTRFRDQPTSDGSNLDLTVDWRPTAKTGVNARLSFTRQTRAGGPTDFSGPTGAIAATYAATGKINLLASASHDVGTNSQYFNYIAVPTDGTTPTLATAVTQNSRTTDAVNLGANYAATAKILVNAGWMYSRSRVVDSVLGNGTEFTDTYRTATLGATYAFSRNVQFGCNLSHLTRDVAGNAGFNYDANVASCSAQVTLR